MVAETVEAPQFDLGTHLRALWRRKSFIGAFVVLMVVGSLFVSSKQTPRYEGRVKLLVERRDLRGLVAGDSGSPTSSDAARTVQDEIEVLKSQPVQEPVQRRFGPDTTMSVSQIGQTDFVTVKAQSGSRARAGAIARLYATSYIDFRRAQDLDALNAATRGVQGRIDDLQRQIDDLTRQINTLADQQVAAAVAQARARNASPSDFFSSEPISGLSAQRSQLLSQQGTLKQQLDTLQLALPLQSGGAQLVTTGPVPTAQVRPRPLQAAIAAFVLGMVLSVGVALLLAYFDDRIRNKDDLDRVLGGLPVLGLIPVLPRSRGGAGGSLAAGDDPTSPFAEAFRSLGTMLQFVGLERQPKVFQVTSPNAADGKSTVAANLATVLAGSGLRAVVVDCDLRRGRLHDLLAVPNSAGFTTAVTGSADVSESVHPVPGVDGLECLPSGPLPPNPTELILSKRAARVLNELQERYDIVVVDCPPLLPVADAVALSAWVDGTILVVAAQTTTRRDLRRTLEVLRQANAPLIGAVLNRATAESHYGYHYRYERPKSGSSGAQGDTATGGTAVGSQIASDRRAEDRAAAAPKALDVEPGETSSTLHG
jgi:capsular exopolysaccharide synthesis family protein